MKKTLQNIFEQYRAAAAVYPLTMVLILLFALTTAIFIDQSNELCQWVETNGIPFLMLWGIGTFFTETMFHDDQRGKWIGVVCTGLISAGFVYFSANGSDVLRENVSHWKMAYGFILVCLGVYGNYKRSGLAFNEWCIRVVHELSRLAILCAITAMGIALVVAVFVTLILGGKHYMLIIRAEFLVTGCLFGIGLLQAQIRLDRELPNFFCMIVKYLLTSLLIVAFAVIYGYILKIIITRVVPSNEIFRILAGLFIIGLPIWTIAGTFPAEHWLLRISRKLPYIFIPFLFLQGYAIRERISAYGLTPLRYLCLVLMLFEVVYIIVYALRMRETGIMLPIMAVLALVSLALPYVNMYSMANRSQKSIFDRYIESDFYSLSDDDQSSLAGAYYYLSGNAAGKNMLASVAPDKIETIKASGKTGIREIDSNMYIYYEFPVLDVDVSAYERMTMLSTFYPDKPNDEETPVDPQAVEFYDGQGNVLLTADVSEFLNRCISSYAAGQLLKPNFSGDIQLDENRLLRVYLCSVTVSNESEQTIPFLNLDAVLLEK